MLDQSFSAHNFEIIYNLENRKGHIKINNMPQEYRDIRFAIRDLKRNINTIRKVAKVKRTSQQQQDLLLWQTNLKEKQQEQKNYLTQYFDTLAKDSSLKSSIELETFIVDGKEYFRLPESNNAILFATKQLQYNIYKTFKVKQSNRHSILTNIKTFLNSKVPVFVIRTDISSFYESVPQDRMFAMIENNTLLSVSSKRMIKDIIDTYESKKDTSLVASGLGLPRGIGISAYLAEIYLRELDQQIRSQREVMFYARYVDDVFIILSALPTAYIRNTPYDSLKCYYAYLKNIFKAKGLKLKPINSSKCSLYAFTFDKQLYSKPASKKITYLGYDISLNVDNGMLKTTFSLSTKKIQKIKNRINNSFIHFTKMSAINIRQATQDLRDSLCLISGNIKLSKTKAGVKAGLYYSNDLLDNKDNLNLLTRYLHSQKLIPYAHLFTTKTEEEKFKNKIKQHIDSIDFTQRWNEKKMYKFSTKRLQEIKAWL